MKAFIRGMAASFAAVVLCLNVYIELRPQYIVGAVWKLGFAALFIMLLGIAFFFGVPERIRAKRRRDYIWILFGYYLWVLANVLFFDNAFGRNFSHLGSLDAVNLEPFRTIRNYLIAYRLGNISGKLTVLNLLGNLTAFAPMGFFLPALYHWQRSIFFFLATLALGITTVEVTQVYSGVGSCDIDDLILNLAGALLVFVICRLTPAIWQYIKRLTPTKTKAKVSRTHYTAKSGSAKSHSVQSGVAKPRSTKSGTIRSGATGATKSRSTHKVSTARREPPTTTARTRTAPKVPSPQKQKTMQSIEAMKSMKRVNKGE